jgi:hypothetical protein
MVGDCGIANQRRDGFLKRKLRHSFSAQSRRDFPALLRRPWRATCASSFGLKFASRLNSLWIRRLARPVICIGVLVMGTERLPRNKQGRLAELSLRVDKRGVEHGHDMHSLLEENALLRRIWLNWISSLKRSLTQGTSHRFTAEPLRLTNAA